MADSLRFKMTKKQRKKPLTEATEIILITKDVKHRNDIQETCGPENISQKLDPFTKKLCEKYLQAAKKKCLSTKKAGIVLSGACTMHMNVMLLN